MDKNTDPPIQVEGSSVRVPTPALGVDAEEILRVLKVDARGHVILSERDVDRIAEAVVARLKELNP